MKKKYDPATLTELAPGTFICDEIPVYQVEPIVQKKDGSSFLTGMKTVGHVGEAPNVMFDTYLCPACDATHFVFTDVLSRTAWCIPLSPLDAEKLAANLINPPPRAKPA